jgi:hypothetical protein
VELLAVSRRTNAAIDADKLREAADLCTAYGLPEHMPVVLRVLADFIENGTRRRE